MKHDPEAGKPADYADFGLGLGAARQKKIFLARSLLREPWE